LLLLLLLRRRLPDLCSLPSFRSRLLLLRRFGFCSWLDCLPLLLLRRRSLLLARADRSLLLRLSPSRSAAAGAGCLTGERLLLLFWLLLRGLLLRRSRLRLLLALQAYVETTAAANTAAKAIQGQLHPTHEGLMQTRDTHLRAICACFCFCH
jgi:hypothetical protein